MLQKVVSSLGSRGYASAVISLTEGGRIGAELKSGGTQVVHLCGSAGFLHPSQLRAMERTVKEFRPDVVHSWMYHANVLAHAVVGLGSRGPRPALVSSVRGCLDMTRHDKLTLRMVRRVDSWLSARAHAVIFNSQRAAEQHAAFGYSMRRAAVIPNCFDTEYFRPRPVERAVVRAELGWGEEIVIGCIARFDPYKDHRSLLRAANLVISRHPACRFVLAGPGCDAHNGELREWIEESGLGGSVQLLGERSDVASLQSALDIAVSSSLSESFPNAVGEAMACATPCVVTDVGDCAFLVGDTGMVVPAGSPVALADALDRMMSVGTAQRRALGERARMRVVTEFGMARITDRIVALYERCVMEARPAPVRQ